MTKQEAIEGHRKLWNGIEEETFNSRRKATNEEFMKENAKHIRKKILPKYFIEVEIGNKNFELRKDEDNIQPGDYIYLCEWDGANFTNRVECRKIKYVLRNVPEYGLKDGYCIIGW